MHPASRLGPRPGRAGEAGARRRRRHRAGTTGWRTSSTTSAPPWSGAWASRRAAGCGPVGRSRQWVLGRRGTGVKGGTGWSGPWRHPATDARVRGGGPEQPRPTWPGCRATTRRRGGCSREASPSVASWAIGRSFGKRCTSGERDVGPRRLRRRGGVVCRGAGHRPPARRSALDRAGAHQHGGAGGVAGRTGDGQGAVRGGPGDRPPARRGAHPARRPHQPGLRVAAPGRPGPARTRVAHRGARPGGAARATPTT